METSHLQLVMTHVWDAEMAAGSSVLRLATLERLGGADHIVQNHLNNAMAGFTQAQQDISSEVFEQLVTPSGTKIAHTASDLARHTDRSPRRVFVAGCINFCVSRTPILPGDDGTVRSVNGQ